MIVLNGQLVCSPSTFTYPLVQRIPRKERQAKRNLHCKAASGPGGADQEDGPIVVPVVQEGADWRDFRAQLVAMSRKTTPPASSSWAHIISQPELGCVLVANPLMFTATQTYFDQAIILITEKSPDYTAGIIINKPSNVRLGDLEGDTPMLPMFADSRLHLGGDVGTHAMNLIHSRAVEGSREVRPGVYMGGTEAVKALVQRGEMLASEVKWYTRFAGWGPGQLESECKRNVWFPASVSADLVLQNVEGDGRHLWHDIMDLLGDEYHNVSEQVRAMRKEGRSRGSLRQERMPGDLPNE